MIIKEIFRRIKLALIVLLGPKQTAYDEDDRIGWRKWV